MPAAVKTAASTPDQLELYRVRDDLAHTHNPANAYERMLVTEMAQAWLRLQHARDTERRYFETRDLVEVITTKLPEFKAVTRFVTESNRAWHKAVEMLQKAQRQRKRTDLSSPNARRSPAPADRPTAEPYQEPIQSAPANDPTEHPRRE